MVQKGRSSRKVLQVHAGDEGGGILLVGPEGEAGGELGKVGEGRGHVARHAMEVMFHQSGLYYVNNKEKIQAHALCAHN